MKRKKTDPFLFLILSCSFIILIFILLPLIEMIFQPSVESLRETLKDKDVLKSIGLSIYASMLAAVISFIFGTPFAYLLARKSFIGKKLVESVVDLPIMIPHPIVGIAILSLAGRDHWLGGIMQEVDRPDSKSQCRR